MQPPHLTHETEQVATSTPAAPQSPLIRPSHLRRYRFLYLSFAIVLLLTFLPPLINLGRYQRRIATSIGNSLGRPVHLDRVSLTLLPLPGFTIENLVVGEDPAFGVEPIIRANSVHATLRFSSLWRGHVEFSTISFTDPSVNLVHAADGRWNVEGILLQASHIETAPTAQRHAGSTPRFPYIEATGARLNFKQEQEKLPFSLVDADFALWLPDPHQWHLRLRAHPTRTDLNISDTGTIELESTLGSASSLTHTPLNLQGQWRDAPLGEATRVLFGRDAGWRGQLNLTAHIRGTFGESAVSTNLHLDETRLSDFVPEKSLTADVECFATATGLFHTFEDLRCSWPPATSSHSQSIALTGAIPNVHKIRESSLQLGTPGIPATTLLSWLRATNSHVPPSLAATGLISGSISYDPPAKNQSPSSSATSTWQGQFALTHATLKAPVEQPPSSETDDDTSASDGSLATLLSADVHLHTPARTAITQRRRTRTPSSAPVSGILLAPTPLLLGGHDPATIEGHFDSSGYTLHLTGPATLSHLQALTRALPPLGEGLLQALPPDPPPTAPFHIDLTATRPWHGPQTWNAPLHPAQPQSSRRPKRRE